MSRNQKIKNILRDIILSGFHYNPDQSERQMILDLYEGADENMVDLSQFGVFQSITAMQYNEILSYRGSKIPGIKRIREILPLGLKEAKELYENIFPESRPVPRY